MRKYTLLFSMAILLANSIAAMAQGMWFPENAAAQYDQMKAMGMDMSWSDIYSKGGSGSLNDVVVHFGGFCTGEVISSQGLVLTNHHCGFDAIQTHSSLENNYLKDGFWAPTFADEKPNLGLYVDFIVHMENVSLEVFPLIAAGTAEREAIAEILEQKMESYPSTGGYRGEIRPVYAENAYELSIARRYSDVRLVGSPPSAIGKYGADTDNWVWPRHTGDFSMFRIYTAPDGSPAEYSTENIPMQVANPLTVSLKGSEEDDFSMMYGFPGRTTSYLPVSEVKQQLEAMLPVRVAMRDLVLSTWDSAMRVDARVKIQYASKYASVSNGWKKWIGQIEGMKAAHGLDTLQARQDAMVAWSQGQALNQGLGGRLVADFDRQNAALEEARLGIVYWQEVLPRWELASWSRLAEDLVKSFDAQKDVQKALDALVEFHKDFSPELDRRASKRLIGAWRTAGANKKGLGVPLEYFAETEAFIQGYFDPSLYASIPVVLSGAYDELDIARIVAAHRNHLAFSLWPDLLEMYRTASASIRPAEAAYAEGNKAWMNERMLAANENGRGIPANIAADANSTLRFAYGRVGGFSPVDGMSYKHFTTAEGILDKYIPGDYEFDLPEALRQKLERREYGEYANAEGDLPVCFLAANHTSGGNSGSPVFNAKGELIGLNFDRVWEGTMSDFYFTPDRCRNIMVDVRYVMWVVDVYAGADRLIQEIKFSR
ncbi:MAG: S46 family peptidase [Cryomorphaceae bacterium]|nr:S46 family peptidase [Cryomorphaceae bacterium]